MRWVAMIAVVGVLGGCQAVVGGEAVSVMATDKTVTDHVISLASGKDCSTLRRNNGGYYCKEDEPKVTPNVHCYQTLGKVTCYDRPDPYKNGQRKVGDNEHNYIK